MIIESTRLSDSMRLKRRKTRKARNVRRRRSAGKASRAPAQLASPTETTATSNQFHLETQKSQNQELYMLASSLPRGWKAAPWAGASVSHALPWHVLACHVRHAVHSELHVIGPRRADSLEEKDEREEAFGYLPAGTARIGVTIGNPRRLAAVARGICHRHDARGRVSTPHRSPPWFASACRAPICFSTMLTTRLARISRATKCWHVRLL
jgi:hypothetical protein